MRAFGEWCVGYNNSNNNETKSGEGNSGIG